GVTATNKLQVTNQGMPDSFAFSATSKNGYPITLTPQNAVLSSGQTVTVAVAIQTPLTASEGTSDQLTFTAVPASSATPNSVSFTSLVVNRSMITVPNLLGLSLGSAESALT